MLETEQKVQLETILKTCDEINASNESAGNEKLTEELYKLVGQYDKKISKEYYKQLKAIKVDLKKQKKVLAKIRNSLKKAMKSKDKGFRDQAIDFNKKQRRNHRRKTEKNPFTIRPFTIHHSQFTI